MISLLTTLIIAAPAFATDTERSSEFDFLEEGERNREKVEADRAPNASIFLEEETDETEPMWEVPDSVGTIDDDDLALEEFDGIDTDAVLSPMETYADPIEDMEGLGPDIGQLGLLGDHFDLSISRSALGTTVAELPLLVARGPNDLQTDLWVVADFYLDGLKVAESRHLFTESGASDAGPTYAWLKAPIPIENPTGTAEVRVFAAPAGKKERLLFVRKAVVTN